MRIAVRRAPALLDFQIRDDGVGFDAATVSPGLGLRGMRERLALLGGDLAIDSRPGSGTELRASIPLSD